MTMDNKGTKVTAQKNSVTITKTSYERIANSVSTWPQWKKNLCNQELIVSVKAKKI